MELDDESILSAVSAVQSGELSGFDLADYCFPEQLRFIQDDSHFKAAVCSRRSGKTVACAADLVYTAIHKPGRVCLYITLSRLNAKRIIWNELLALNTRFDLGGDPNETELSITFPNASIIYLTGAKDKSEIEKFRGIAITLCYIDEAQSFRSHIKELIDDVIGPALMDYAGTLCLIGTPGPVPAGYFYDCAVKSPAWSKHGWTFWDNPFIRQKSGEEHKVILDRELERRGIGVDDPSIQREWFGKWVLDSDALLLHYDRKVNHFESMAPGRWNYILGIDIGFHDADALAVLAWSEADAATYLVEESVTSRQGITELVQQIEKLQKKYDICKIVMDTGGLGLKISEEIQRRHQIPIQAADKHRKFENVALLNDTLRSGRFKAQEGSRFAQDTFLVEIDRDKSTPDKIKIKDNYHSDIIDAVLYAFRESPAFTYTPPKPALKWGTPAWAAAEVDEMEQQAIDHFEALEEATKGYGLE